MTMEERLIFENFNTETDLLNELTIEREQVEIVELEQFSLETKLIEKGVI